MWRTQFSIRALLLMTLLASIAIPLALTTYPHVVRYFSPPTTEIVFPDFKQWQRDIDAAKLDRETRENRLIGGLDTVDDAMNRFAKNDFIGCEKIEGNSGWIMTTDSGAQHYRATLQRQSSLFAVVGDAAVPDLLKWLEHDQIEIRYIASYALKEITGLNPALPHFSTLQELKDDGWLASSVAEYENWISAARESESAK